MFSKQHFDFENPAFLWDRPASTDDEDASAQRSTAKRELDRKCESLYRKLVPITMRPYITDFLPSKCAVGIIFAAYLCGPLTEFRNSIIPPPPAGEIPQEGLHMLDLKYIQPHPLTFDIDMADQIIREEIEAQSQAWDKGYYKDPDYIPSEGMDPEAYYNTITIHLTP